MYQNNIIMKILDIFKNNFLYANKYKTHSEAVIIACYYNPTHNPYRLKAFNEFYESIKHLNHRIVECVISDATPELPENDFIKRVSTNTTLWHKESLLNGIIAKLPTKFKYVFWVDADVIFTNKNWVIDAVAELQKNNMVQLFEYCVHLDQDELTPKFNLHEAKDFLNSSPSIRNPKLWRSFGANHVDGTSGLDNYDKHGHVGFAWGAKRYLLDAWPLYDKALIGGADHIMAHAAAGQIGHSCILKSFTDDIDAVNKWSETFYKVMRGKVGFVKGDLYHIWHGALENRQYLKRIQDFTSTAKEIKKKDENGLYVTDNDEYVKQYFDHRETTGSTKPKAIVQRSLTTKQGKKISVDNDVYQRKLEELESQHPNSSSSFIDSLLIGYFTDSTMMGTAMGGDLLGAALGDMLNGDDNSIMQDFGERGNPDQGFEDGFGGGGFSGGGSSGEWEDNNAQNDNFS